MENLIADHALPAFVGVVGVKRWAQQRPRKHKRCEWVAGLAAIDVHQLINVRMWNKTDPIAEIFSVHDTFPYFFDAEIDILREGGMWAGRGECGLGNYLRRSYK